MAGMQLLPLQEPVISKAVLLHLGVLLGHCFYYVIAIKSDTRVRMHPQADWTER
jgi:hypothetical protein